MSTVGAGPLRYSWERDGRPKGKGSIKTGITGHLASLEHTADRHQPTITTHWDNCSVRDCRESRDRCEMVSRRDATWLEQLNSTRPIGAGSVSDSPILGHSI